MEGSDKGQSASPARAAGDVMDRPPAEARVELEVAEGWHCKRVDFITVLQGSSPKREHFEPPILISRPEHFPLLGSSILSIFVVSSTLTPSFPTRSFCPFGARFGIGGFHSFASLHWPILGRLRISISVLICGMHSILR